MQLIMVNEWCILKDMNHANMQRNGEAEFVVITDEANF